MDTVPDIIALNAHEPRFEILEAAAACFEERGFASTSIDDVARRLGSTKGRIYHHFSSKTDLFTAVYRHGMEMLHVHLQPLVARDMDPLQKLKLLATEHVRMMLATRAFQRVVWEGVELHLRGATTPEQREAFDALIATRERYSAYFRQAEEAAKAAGLLDYENLSIANQVMFMTLNSPIFWYKPRPGETDEDRAALVRQIVTYALRGLGARKELIA